MNGNHIKNPLLAAILDGFLISVVVKIMCSAVLQLLSSFQRISSHTVQALANFSEYRVKFYDSKYFPKISGDVS